MNIDRLVAKPTFIMHIDKLKILDELEDNDVAKLFRAIKAFQEGDKGALNELLNDKIVKISFTPFRTQFEADNLKYIRTCEKNKENGKKGGRPKTHPASIKPKKPTRFYENPKNLDTDTDTDTDTVSSLYIPNQLTVDERKSKFREEIDALREKYDRETLNRFYCYWTECNKEGLLRFECEEFWDTEKRLFNWVNRENYKKINYV